VDGSIEAALAELDMEHYDDDGDDEDAGAARLFGGSGRPTYYASNEEDPYITLHEEEDEEELSDFTLRPTGTLAAHGARQAAAGEEGARRARQPDTALFSCMPAPAQTWCYSRLARRTT
jgi:hypothetical protein